MRVPPGRTLNRITVAEYGFDQARRGWVLLQRGAPIPSVATAEAQSAAYRWQLKAGAGVRFLQIWATDSTGAVTSYPYQTFINLVPESTRVDRGKVDVYRFALHAGEQFDVQLTSTSGDADLAIWGPIGDTSMRWVSNSRGGTDQVTLVAPVDGVYQVEVRGYTRADYRLSTVVEVAAVLSGTSLANVFNTAEVVDDKPLPEAPAISVDDAPALENDQSLRVFLPLIRR